MTIAEAIEVLRQHDRWLCGICSKPMQDPRVISKATRIVCDYAETKGESQ